MNDFSLFFKKRYHIICYIVIMYSKNSGSKNPQVEKTTNGRVKLL